MVAAMAQQASGPMRTFSIGFDVAAYDETRYAARGRPACSAPSTRSSGSSRTRWTCSPQLVWHYGEPFADDSAIPTYYLAELTRRHVTVALNGDGGDESFAGYSRYLFHDVVRRFEWVPGPLRRRPPGVSGRRCRRQEPPSGPPARPAGWPRASGARCPSATRPPWPTCPPTFAIELYTPEFRRDIDARGLAGAGGDRGRDPRPLRR